MLMYLIFPLIYQIMNKVNNYTTIPIIWAVCIYIMAGILCCNGYTEIANNNSFFYFNILEQMPCFLFGCTLHLDVEKGRKGNFVLGILEIAGAVGCYYFGYIFSERGLWYLVMPWIFSAGCRQILMEQLELSEHIKVTGVIAGVLSKFGKNSFYIFLAHSFWVWTLPQFLCKILKLFQMRYNPNILYIILLPTMVAGSYFMGIIFGKICNPIYEKMRILLLVSRPVKSENTVSR